MSTLAVTGGRRVVGRAIDIRWPVVDEDDRRNVLRALNAKAGWCRLQVEPDKSETSQFEAEFATYHDSKYCLAIANGTVAIEAALKATGMNPGDEVIVPSITFVATASAVLMARGIPVFADCLPETCQIDPADVEHKITSRTTGIVVVHYGGYPVEIDKLKKIAKKHGLFLIEDCAHAQGTMWRNRKVGARATAGTFSFQGSKSLNSGEGGAIVTDKKGLYEKAYAYHHIGRTLGSKKKYDHTTVGPNYRLSELQSAVLRSQLKKLPGQTQTRVAHADLISAGIADIPGIVPLRADRRITQRGYYFYVLRFDESVWGIRRAAFLKAFNAESVNIGIGVGYSAPVYALPVFRDNRFDETGCPVRGTRKYGHTVSYKRVRNRNAERIAYHEHLTVSNRLLLSEAACKAVPKIVDKLWENRDALRKLKS